MIIIVPAVIAAGPYLLKSFEHATGVRLTDYMHVLYSSMAECEPSSSSVEENQDDTSSNSTLDSSIDSVHSSSPSHISHADVEVHFLYSIFCI